MSLKGLELQIAIPKTFDAGKIADNHQQNTIQQQINANEALKREIERKQTAVNESEDLDGITEEEREKGNGQQSMMNDQKNNKNQPQKEKAKHPFKGNLVDFSG